MESSLTQRFRNLAKKQARSVVDAIIDDNHHLTLKTAEGNVIDAGPIKVKPPGTLAYIGYSIENSEPDLYITKDGRTWQGATSQGRYSYGTNSYVDAWCWTGDRFLVWVSPSIAISNILQSRDGGTWAFHPDDVTFNSSSLTIAMDATGTGLVVAVGDPNFGADGESCVAISRDFGETWEVIPYDTDLYPFSGAYLYGVALKNDKEWCITDGSTVWYTYDGGSHWSEVTYPTGWGLNTQYSSGIRYFNGCWWFYGYPVSDGGEWDTPLIKSDDLINWTPVITPWSNNYPPLAPYLGITPVGWSGEISNLVHDPITNTVIANGYSDVTSSVVMMSTDGGEHWFELGPVGYDYFRTDYGWDGIYNWPDDWSFEYEGGMACGFGWWFVINGYGSSPDYYVPPIVRISTDGRITEAVYPPDQTYTYGYVMLSGGDVT